MVRITFLSVRFAVILLVNRKQSAGSYREASLTQTLYHRGIVFEEPFDFNRLKSGSSHMTVMRAEDAAKRARQEIPVPTRDNSDTQLPLLALRYPGLVSPPYSL